MQPRLTAATGRLRRKRQLIELVTELVRGPGPVRHGGRQSGRRRASVESMVYDMASRRVLALEARVERQEQVIAALLQSPTQPPKDRAASALAGMQARLAIVGGSVVSAEQRQEDSEAAKRGWIDDGRLVGSAQLSAAWGRTRQALDQAVERGELFCLRVGNRRFYLAVFKELAPEAVGAVSKALRGVDPVSQFLFWQRPHGALQGRTISEVVRGGDTVAATKTAEAFAREQLGGHAAAA